MTRLLPGRLADPTGALRLVSRRVGMVSAVWLLGVAAVAWAITAVQASSMHGMASGSGQIGMRAPMTTTAPTS